MSLASDQILSIAGMDYVITSKRGPSSLVYVSPQAAVSAEEQSRKKDYLELIWPTVVKVHKARIVVSHGECWIEPVPVASAPTEQAFVGDSGWRA